MYMNADVMLRQCTVKADTHRRVMELPRLRQRILHTDSGYALSFGLHLTPALQRVIVYMFYHCSA